MFLQPSAWSHDMDRCVQVLQGRCCLEALSGRLYRRPSCRVLKLQHQRLFTSLQIKQQSCTLLRPTWPLNASLTRRAFMGWIKLKSWCLCFSTCRTERTWVSQTTGGTWREITDEKMLRQSQKKSAAWDVESGIWCVWRHLKINHFVQNLLRLKSFGLLWMLKTCFMLISVSVALWLLLFTGEKCSHLVTVLMTL